MNKQKAKLDYLTHCYTRGLLHAQVINGLNKKNQTGYFLTESALSLIYIKLKNKLNENDEIMILLKKILSKKKFLKDIELSKQLFKL